MIDPGTKLADAESRSSAATNEVQYFSISKAWLRSLSMIAAVAIAALLGALAMHWMTAAKVDVPAIASPNRIVFDTMRGEAIAALVDRPRDSSAPLLIDIAVPTQATAVMAHFSDQSSIPLPVSIDGFVSLAGPRGLMLSRSPIRIAWMLEGQPQGRRIDLRSALDNAKN